MPDMTNPESAQQVRDICESVIDRCHVALFRSEKKIDLKELSQMLLLTREAWWLLSGVETDYGDGEDDLDFTDEDE